MPSLGRPIEPRPDDRVGERGPDLIAPLLNGGVVADDKRMLAVRYPARECARHGLTGSGSGPIAHPLLLAYQVGAALLHEQRLNGHAVYLVRPPGRGLQALGGLKLGEKARAYEVVVITALALEFAHGSLAALVQSERPQFSDAALYKEFRGLMLQPVAKL